MPTQLLLLLLLYLAPAGADEEGKDEEVKVQNVYRARELLGHWEQIDDVEVFYGEFLLASWVLDHAPWNAYHSGLAFRNGEEKCVYDYSPTDVSSVMKMLMPEIIIQDNFSALLGNYEMKWHDGARTQLTLEWNKAYERFVRLGTISGATFVKFTDWVAKEFAPTHNAFQPIEVASVTPGGSPVLVRSSMCHDFVTDALWFFYHEGHRMQPESHVFRDHIIMYATDATEVSSLLEGLHGMRQWGRYLRQLELSLERIRQQFTFAREALIWNWRLRLPAFLHTEHRSYQVQLSPPFLNYCYLPLAMPPEVHDPLGKTKLCALGLEANLTNSTAPWPWGTMLSTEEHLDRWEVPVAILLVTLVGVVFAADSAKEATSSAQEDRKSVV